MSRDFRDDDRDKAVFGPNGEQIGLISAVHGNTATVRRDTGSSLTEGLKQLLGWSDENDEHDLHTDQVDRFDTRGVHIRR